MYPDALHLEFETIDCPICESEHHVALVSQDRHGLGLSTVLCGRCGFVFTNPMPKKKSLNDFYRHSYRQLYRKNSSVNTATLIELGVAERVAAAYSYISKVIDLDGFAAILDFGAADGSLLQYFKKHHPQLSAYGVEPSTEYRDFASGVVQAEFFADIEDIPATKRFDFISLNHVLEHLAEPVEFLRRLIGFLNLGGVLYVDVPSLMAYRSYDDIHIAHVGHYTFVSLQNLAAVLGLRITHFEEHRPVNHPVSLRCIAIKCDKFEDIASLDDSELKRIKSVFERIKRRMLSYRLKKHLSGFISLGKLRRLICRAQYYLVKK